MNSQVERWLIGGLLLALSGAVFIGLYFLPSTSSLQTEVGLPLLAIAGVIALLVSIALVAGAFTLFDLSDKTQALGLPEGSVRAVIALSLVVLFAVLTIYLYTDMSRDHPVSKDNLTLAEKEQFKNNLASDQYISAISRGEDDKQRWTVYYRSAPHAASDDFAKQLLVMIGTLVTSVASFYFGSKTANVTTAPTQKVQPTIRSIDPTTQARGAAFDLVIYGDNLDLIKEAKVTLGAAQVAATDITSNASLVKCKLIVPVGEPAGTWDVSVNDGVGQRAQLPAALTMT